MNWDDDDLEMAYKCAAAQIRSCQLGGRPIPPTLRRFYDRVDLAIRCMSATGQETDSGGQQLEQDDWITTPEVAAIVNCSARTAQRLAERELGEKHGGRWLCRRSVVENYAQEGKPA
jgi:Helix-turn-helix domain